MDSDVSHVTAATDSNQENSTQAGVIDSDQVAATYWNMAAAWDSGRAAVVSDWTAAINQVADE
jgi:hypothetical protein